MILRRRDDLARVMRELGGQLFARKGNVDKYFEPETCNDRLEDERGQVFLCSLPRGHEGYHESENQEWLEMPLSPLEGKVTEMRFIDDVPNEQEVARAVQHILSYRRDKMLDAIYEHIRTAPERESAALRRANIRQACHAR